MSRSSTVSLIGFTTPSSPGSASSGGCTNPTRRWRRSQSWHRLSAILYSHDENLACPLKRYESAKRTQERFLADLAGVLVATHHAIGERVDGPLPAHHELVERVRAAAGGDRDQLLVGPVHACTRCRLLL